MIQWAVNYDNSTQVFESNESGEVIQYLAPDFLEATQAKDSVYSDRMYQWDFKKFNRCAREVFGNEGQDFSRRETSKIQEFLSRYLGKPVKLLKVSQLVNASSGFPYWHFEYISS